MVRFISLSFLFLGWAFYELSGGNEFEPRVHPVSEPQIVAETVLPKSDPALTATTKDLPVVLAKADLPTQQPQSSDAQTADVILASVPTTKRLVGEPQPTAVNEIAKLGPARSADPEPAAEAQAIVARASLAFDEPDFRRVTGNRVNMRNGPGTHYSVVAKLLRHSEVEILQEPGNGWVKLQSLETGRVGWMAASLLAKIPN